MSPNTLTTRPTISTLTAWHNASTCAARSNQRRCVRNRGPTGSSRTGSWIQREPSATSTAAPKQSAAPRGCGIPLHNVQGVATWIYRRHAHTPVGHVPGRIHREIPLVSAASQHLDRKLRPRLSPSESVLADPAGLRRFGPRALRDRTDGAPCTALVSGVRRADETPNRPCPT